MATSCFDPKAEQRSVMELFRAGRSKAEIGREIGKTKEQVARILAAAIKEAAHG